tara:strand:- start:392 stop:751 length:360 start_codon:yes stop_codon:yes gene_type:complete
MKYSNIKSLFIKTQLKKTNWLDRRYIDDLILLHHFTINGVSNYIAANFFSDLKFKYQREYLKLIQEDIKMNPNEKRIKYYPKIIKEFNDRRIKIKEWAQDEIKMECLLKEDWKKSGGKF